MHCENVFLPDAKKQHGGCMKIIFSFFHDDENKRTVGASDV
jgi:hypothetical protein